jgi:hypothetical protein
MSSVDRVEMIYGLYIRVHTDANLKAIVLKFKHKNVCSMFNFNFAFEMFTIRSFYLNARSSENA